MFEDIYFRLNITLGQYVQSFTHHLDSYGLLPEAVSSSTNEVLKKVITSAGEFFSTVFALIIFVFLFAMKYKYTLLTL